VRVTVVGLPFFAVLVKMLYEVTDVREVGSGLLDASLDVSLGELLVVDSDVVESVGLLDWVDDGAWGEVVEEVVGKLEVVMEDEELDDAVEG